MLSPSRVEIQNHIYELEKKLRKEVDDFFQIGKVVGETLQDCRRGIFRESEHARVQKSIFSNIHEIATLLDSLVVLGDQFAKLPDWPTGGPDKPEEPAIEPYVPPPSKEPVEPITEPPVIIHNKPEFFHLNIKSPEQMKYTMQTPLAVHPHTGIPKLALITNTPGANSNYLKLAISDHQNFSLLAGDKKIDAFKEGNGFHTAPSLGYSKGRLQLVSSCHYTPIRGSILGTNLANQEEIDLTDRYLERNKSGNADTSSAVLAHQATYPAFFPLHNGDSIFTCRRACAPDAQFVDRTFGSFLSKGLNSTGMGPAFARHDGRTIRTMAAEKNWTVTCSQVASHETHDIAYILNTWIEGRASGTHTRAGVTAIDLTKEDLGLTETMNHNTHYQAPVPVPGTFKSILRIASRKHKGVTDVYALVDGRVFKATFNRLELVQSMEEVPEMRGARSIHANKKGVYWVTSSQLFTPQGQFDLPFKFSYGQFAEQHERSGEAVWLHALHSLNNGNWYNSLIRC